VIDEFIRDKALPAVLAEQKCFVIIAVVLDMMRGGVVLHVNVSDIRQHTLVLLLLLLLQLINTSGVITQLSGC